MDRFSTFEDVSRDSALYLDGEPVTEPTNVSPLAIPEAEVLQLGDIAHGTLPEEQIADAMADVDAEVAPEVDDVTKGNALPKPIRAAAHIALQDVLPEAV